MDSQTLVAALNSLLGTEIDVSDERIRRWTEMIDLLEEAGKSLVDLHLLLYESPKTPQLKALFDDLQALAPDDSDDQAP